MTNDTTPATDEEIENIRRGSLYRGGAQGTCLALIARIEALQTEIESKNADIMNLEERLEVETCRLSKEITALRGLCGRAGEEIYQMAHYINPDPEQGGNQLADELLDRASKGEL